MKSTVPIGNNEAKEAVIQGKSRLIEPNQPQKCLFEHGMSIAPTERLCQ